MRQWNIVYIFLSNITQGNIKHWYSVIIIIIII